MFMLGGWLQPHVSTTFAQDSIEHSLLEDTHACGTLKYAQIKDENINDRENTETCSSWEWQREVAASPRPKTEFLNNTPKKSGFGCSSSVFIL